jgi:uncharacterized iron-regulated protein
VPDGAIFALHQLFAASPSRNETVVTLALSPAMDKPVLKALSAFPMRLRALPQILRAILLAVVVNGAPASAKPLPLLPPWQTQLLRDHSLVGQIVRVGSLDRLSPSGLVAALATAPFVLLGEKHDNPDHHARQAWIIDALAESGRRPAVVLEMITMDQAPALAAYLAQSQDPAGLGPAIGWEKAGWPSWSMYQPIAAAALVRRLTIAAGDLPQATIRNISRDGLARQPKEFRVRLGLDQDYSAVAAASLRRELADSHCGMLPETALPRMSDVQRSRDAHMAIQLLEAGQSAGAVLIAGAGHVRKDRAVPWHLSRLAAGRTAATLSFVEVDRNRRAPSDYGIDPETNQPLFDYIWFTPRVDDVDPCAKNREQLERLRQRP